MVKREKEDDIRLQNYKFCFNAMDAFTWVYSTKKAKSSEGLTQN